MTQIGFKIHEWYFYNDFIMILLQSFSKLLAHPQHLQIFPLPNFSAGGTQNMIFAIKLPEILTNGACSLQNASETMVHDIPQLKWSKG